MGLRAVCLIHDGSDSVDPDLPEPDPPDAPPAGGRQGRRGRVALSAALVTGLVGLSQLLGFVRDAVNAWAFGAGSGYDAYLVAQGLMNLVLGLIGGAMAKATVPTVSRAAERGRAPSGLHSARVGLTVATCVLAAGSVVMWVAAPVIVAALAPGFDTATAATAVELTRIVVVASLFIAGTNILAATAQAHRRFFAAGVQGVPFNLAMIAAAVLFGQAFGVRAIAVGFVVGSALRLLIQIPPVRRLGMPLRPSFDVRDEGFREMSRLVPLLLVGSALGNVNTLVDRAVGSMVGTGVISALSYGYRLVQLPYALLVVALATVLYPSFGSVSLASRRPELRRLVQRGISMLVVLLLPIVALLVVAGRYLVIVLFGRGDFTDTAVGATTTAVAWFAAGLVGLGVREILARASYALGDARAPVGSAVVGMVVNVVGDVLLGPRFGVAGLAVATTVSLFVAASLLALLLSRRHDAVRLRALVPVAAISTGAAALAAMAALGVLTVARSGLGAGDRPGTLGALALVTAAAVPLLAVYTALLALARRPELSEVTQLFAQLASRLRRKRGLPRW